MSHLHAVFKSNYSGVGCAVRTSDNGEGGNGAHSAPYAEETLIIELDNYVLPSPEVINLDEANRAKLHGIINSEPLALIEYWAVDPGL